MNWPFSILKIFWQVGFGWSALLPHPLLPHLPCASPSCLGLKTLPLHCRILWEGESCATLFLCFPQTSPRAPGTLFCPNSYSVIVCKRKMNEKKKDTVKHWSKDRESIRDIQTCICICNHVDKEGFYLLKKSLRKEEQRRKGKKEGFRRGRKGKKKGKGELRRKGNIIIWSKIKIIYLYNHWYTYASTHLKGFCH